VRPVLRRLYLVLIPLAVILFVAISALLARAWSADGAESSAITDLVKAEARGSTPEVIGAIQRCRSHPACRARAASDAAQLRHRGSVSIIQLQPSTGFTLTGTLGTARVAWEVGSSLPIVQCVRVRRAGNVIQGLRIELLEVSRRIKSDAVCPASF
jgi:hypothetical protein